MKVTNKLHLPEAFVRAVNVERHNKEGCYSATTLNKGTKETVLQERHWPEIEVDAADQVWATFGSAVHSILERYEDGNFHEEYFDVAVLNSRVTGTVDSYDMEHGVIVDWKTAPVFKVQKSEFDDWYKQGMVYAWLLVQNGFYVRRCCFIALLKDHSKSKAKLDCSYPQSPVYVYEFAVTPEALERTGERIKAKVAEIEAAELLSDDEIAPCTEEERWAEPTTYAVTKNGNKRAVRVFSTLAQAEAFAGEMGNSYFVETRKAVSRKCENYCICKDYCNFYKTQGGK